MIKMKYSSNQYFTNINHMAFALMLNSITSVLMGLLDQTMVGRLSVSAYGAVGVVSSSIYSITGILGMLAVAFNILGAQNKLLESNAEFFNKFNITQLINLLIGIVSFLIIQIFKVPILKVFFGLEGEILKEGIKYLNIYSLTIGLNLILFTFSSLFKILDGAKFIFYGNMIANISNLFIDYVLIYGKFGFPKMGVTGAAIGSVAGLLLNAGFYIIILTRVHHYKWNFKWKIKYINQLIKKSIPLMGQEFLDGTLFSIVTVAIVSRIGVTQVAVFTLIFNLINVLLMPMYAYSSASLNFVSKSFYEKDNKVARQIPGICVGMAALFYIVIGVMLLYFKMPVLKFIVTDMNVIRMAGVYILMAVIAYFMNVPHSVYKYSLQGSNDELWVFVASLIVNGGCMFIMIYLTLHTEIHLTGVYISIALNYFILSLVFYIRYKKQTGIRSNN